MKPSNYRHQKHWDSSNNKSKSFLMQIRFNFYLVYFTLSTSPKKYAYENTLNSINASIIQPVLSSYLWFTHWNICLFMKKKKKKFRMKKQQQKQKINCIHRQCLQLFRNERILLFSSISFSRPLYKWIFISNPSNLSIEWMCYEKWNRTMNVAHFLELIYFLVWFFIYKGIHSSNYYYVS